MPDHLPPHRARLLLIFGGIILAIIVMIFVGMNLSHVSQMQGGQG